MKPYIAMIVLALVFGSNGEMETTASGLKFEITTHGTNCDSRPKIEDTAVVHYTGTLDDGRKFDSSRDRGEPFKFQVGVGEVIKGWDEAILGMCVGERRKIIVPPELGYGAKGAGGVIPPYAILHFDMELIRIE